MKNKSFANRWSYHYVFFILILIIGILAFYLSCKSKSPTEATSALNNQIAGKSTSNTTTSSSTTTTVRPGSSPTNTTTLITSRTLTSTSTSTSSTSTSTTTSRPTTTTTTTSIKEPNLKWCSFTVENSYWGYAKLITKKDRRTGTYEGAPMTLSNFVMKNTESIPAENVVISVDKIIGDLNHIIITKANTGPGTIPNSGQCEKMQFKGNDSILLYIHGSAHPSEEWTVWLIESYSQTRFSFIIFVT